MTHFVVIRPGIGSGKGSQALSKNDHHTAKGTLF